jgi:hypothetical protein
MTAFGLLTIAAVLLAGSFLVATPSASVVGSGHVGSISTGSSQSRQVDLAALPSGTASQSFDIHASIRPYQLPPFDPILQMGSGPGAWQVLVDPSVGNEQGVMLSTVLANRSTFTVALIDHVSSHRSYSIHLSLNHSRVLTAWVNGTLQFQYSYPTSEFTHRLSPILIGRNAAPRSIFRGSVSGFSMSYQGFGPIPKGKKTATLRLAAGLALALALLILFLGWVSTRWAEPDRAARDGRSTAIRRSWAAVDRFPSVAAVLLLSGGVAALALATPLDNSDARASGYQRITTNPVTPGHWDGADFGDELAIFRTSLVGDVHLSFQMLVPKLPIHIHRFTANVVVASDGNRGILFQVSTTGQLRALVGERYLPVPGSIPLSAKVPTDKWVTVAVDIERDQSFSFTIDHQQVSVFAYALPALNALPIGFSAGGGFYGTFGGYVRNAVMTVHLYNPGSPQSDHDAQRGVQILGAIAVALGVMLLCRRWLRNLVPLTENTKRPIIFAAFGTAGALIVLDFVVGLLRFQSTSNPTVARNTWLFAPYVQFSDFFQVFDIFKNMHPYGIEAGTYPPVGYWLVGPVSWMNQYAAVFVFLAVFAGFMAWWTMRSFAWSLTPIEKLAVILITFASLPVSIAIDRGNVDLWVFIFVAIGIAAFESRKKATAATLIGLAAAAKLAPVIYLLVFVRKGQWRFIILGVTVAAMCSLAGFASFGGSLSGNIHGFTHALSNLEESYNHESNSTFYNSSIYGWAQSIGYATGGLHGSLDVRVAIAPFAMPLEIVAALVLGWYLYAREEAVWRAVTLMTLWMLLFQDVVYYYELLFIFIPLALFVKHASANARDIRIACVFGLILGPKTYFYFGNGLVDNSVLFTAPLLVLLFILVLHHGILDRRAARQAGDTATVETRVNALR